jgi:hypothetical protein
MDWWSHLRSSPNLQKDFSHPSEVIYSFQTLTLKLKTGTANRWETTNSNSPGPIEQSSWPIPSDNPPRGPKNWSYFVGSHFGQHFCTICWGSSNAQQKGATAREEHDKYELTTIPCFFWLADHIDLSRRFAINSLPPGCSPTFSLMGGEPKIKTKLGYEKYLCKVTYWAPLGMLLL